MGGGLTDFGNALKAFRRASYQHPDAWNAVVVCLTTSQRKFAFEEAMRIIDGSSMKAVASPSAMSISTDRHTRVKFVLCDYIEPIQGMRINHVISLCDLPANTRDVLIAQSQRNDHYMWHDSTL